MKQNRYLNKNGQDWIEEFENSSTIDEFRGAMRFTIGKYNKRIGKKDSIVDEVEKIADYANRWLDYEKRSADVTSGFITDDAAKFTNEV